MSRIPQLLAVSVVVPVYNEARNLAPLFARISSALKDTVGGYEIIAVDDGSTDDSFSVMAEAARHDQHLRPIRFTRNVGQTAALVAGIAAARGTRIVTIDSDLENDPADIPKLLAKLDEGFDVVSGWRTNRWNGAFFTRQLPSYIANKLISRLTGVPLHDFGCTLKAYRAEAVTHLKLYGEMHRFIPAYAAWEGARVAELPVSHSPRVNGISNYGIGRTFRVLLDLIVLVFLHRYMNRPMHFFGAWGFASFTLGIFAGLAAIILRFFGLHLIETPLPVLSALLLIVGVQLMLFGIIAEILMRTYYESQNRLPYRIREESNEPCAE